MSNEEMTRELAAEIKGRIKLKNIHGIWDCLVSPGIVEMDGLTIRSRDLSEYLRGCRQVVLMAATLGAEADALIRRYSVMDMAKAVYADTLCNEMIEEYCDSLYPRRFSPGYGDFDIARQKDITRLLDCEKRIGLTVTDGYMLAPAKSVTAVIGVKEG
jgi:5-methyltetrahydrofolate--homocysteine methyltransferase